MNNLLTHNGGQPVHLDDFRHIQSAYLQGFEALSKTYFPNGYGIISGIEVSQSGNFYTVSGGFIVWDGEIMWFPPALSTTPQLQIVPNIYVPPAGMYIFRDGVTRGVREIRDAKIYDPANDPAPSYTLTTAPQNYLQNALAADVQVRLDVDFLAQQDARGSRYDFINTDFQLNVVANTNNPPYMIKKHGRVHCYGSVIFTGGNAQSANNFRMLLLPNDFKAFHLAVHPTVDSLYHTGLTSGNGIMSIKTDLNYINAGDVITAPSITGNKTIYLDGLSWDHV